MTSVEESYLKKYILQLLCCYYNTILHILILQSGSVFVLIYTMMYTDEYKLKLNNLCCTISHNTTICYAMQSSYYRFIYIIMAVYIYFSVSLLGHDNNPQYSNDKHIKVLKPAYLGQDSCGNLAVA